MRRILFVCALIALTLPLAAQEKLTLSAPIAKPSLSEWSVARFSIDVEAVEILVTVKADNGEYKAVRYPNATTDAAQTVTLINALNTANLSTKSLRRRILERLQADGHLGAGTFSGGN